MRQMMEANFMTNGPVLALRRSQPFLLQTLEADNFTYAQFREELEAFINLVEAWSMACANQEPLT